MSAQKARGADFETGRLTERAKALLPILVPLFVSAFRRADELAVAMESRCYHGGAGRTRMKALRFFAGLALLMSTRPGQTQALRGLLRDSEKKEFDIWLFNDAEVTGDEKTGTIELESHGQNEEIHVSPEDYAQVFEYITFKPKRRRKTASKTTKKEKAIP